LAREGVFTGVFKEPVTGPRRVRKLNVDGDGQADLAGHGGEQRAVFVYQIESYRYWERELGRNDFVNGQFGENFTIEGPRDDEVCIGDRYRIGTAIFEVTQPRVTCYGVGIRMNDPRIPALLVSHPTMLWPLAQAVSEQPLQRVHARKITTCERRSSCPTT
jgi:MOSC domain-containing protein YiiM